MEMLFAPKQGNAWIVQFDKWHIAMGCSVCSLFLITLTIVGYLLGRDVPAFPVMNANVMQAWQEHLVQQDYEVERVRSHANAELAVLAKRVAELQTDLHQLDDLSLHLAELADIDPDEWEMMRTTAVGGPIDGIGRNLLPKPTDFMLSLNDLTEQLARRAQQLGLLEKFLLTREFSDVMSEVSRVIERGWVSSYYGYRQDPFTKRKAWHAGIDLSGRRGTAIKSIAPGVVNFVGLRPGYGNLVEIDHGNGFVTRYAHNHSNLVNQGDMVHKGQVVAEMGSTGRATGVHVHFEVLKNGEHINPLPYIKAAH